MKKGYEKAEVDRILSTLREAMRALVARTTLTHDNQLYVTQNLLRATYSGWSSQDVPASVPMVMRDLAVKHDQNLDAEIFRISGAFETADRLIRQAVEMDEYSRESNVEQEDEEPKNNKQLSFLSNICEVAKSLPLQPYEGPASQEEEQEEESEGVDIIDMVAVVAEHIRRSKTARTLDELIESCLSSGFQTSRSELRRVLRELEANGDVVELPGSNPRYTMIDLDLNL